MFFLFWLILYICNHSFNRLSTVSAMIIELFCFRCKYLWILWNHYLQVAVYDSFTFITSIRTYNINMDRSSNMGEYILFLLGGFIFRYAFYLAYSHASFISLFWFSFCFFSFVWLFILEVFLVDEQMMRSSVVGKEVLGYKDDLMFLFFSHIHGCLYVVSLFLSFFPFVHIWYFLCT